MGRDEEGLDDERSEKWYKRYVASGSYWEFQGKVSAMFVSAVRIENLPANIPMSAKGIR